MNTALSDQNTPSETQEHISRSFKQILDAFFEGHHIRPEQRDAYLKRIRKELAVPAPQVHHSRIRIATERDINRMWAAHEKAQRKPKK